MAKCIHAVPILDICLSTNVSKGHLWKLDSYHVVCEVLPTLRVL